MRIDIANLSRQYLRYKSEIDTAMGKVLLASRFITGEEVLDLETELARSVGTKHAITCSSGSDALLLALMAIDIEPGDEVITTTFAFIAAAESIAFLKAKPVFVDIDEMSYTIDASKIEAAITPKTRAIIPVSIYGQPADMDEINTLAVKYGLKVIEDAAQSFGARYKGKRSCSLSDMGCTSFSPGRSLGCFGDGGAVFTDDDKLAQKLMSLRVHGQTGQNEHHYIGMEGRLDTLQAAVLQVKLDHFIEDQIRRQDVAAHYEKLVPKAFSLPIVKADRTSAWEEYAIRVKQRDTLEHYLYEMKIPTAIHYPTPLHLQQCFAYLGHSEGDFPVAEKIAKEILSLPINPDLDEDELVYIMTSLLVID